VKVNELEVAAHPELDPTTVTFELFAKLVVLNVLATEGIPCEFPLMKNS